MKLENPSFCFLDKFFVLLKEKESKLGKITSHWKAFLTELHGRRVGIWHLHFPFYFFLCAKQTLLPHVPNVPTMLQAAEQDFTGTHSFHHMSRFLSAVPNGLSIPSLTPNYSLTWQMLKLHGKWKSNCFKDKKLRGKSEERPQDPEWKGKKREREGKNKSRGICRQTQ